MKSLRIRLSPWRMMMSAALGSFATGIASPAYPAGLSLESAIATAVEGNKDLRATRYAVEQARARLVQAGLLPSPRLELSHRSDLLFRNEGEYTAGIGVSQEFPVAGRIARQKDVARADVALALAEIKQAELKVANQVASGFYRVLALDRQIESREQLIAVDQRLVKGTRNRFKAAEVSELDVNAAQLDLQRLSQERALLLSQRATQLTALNQLLGRSATQPLDLDTSLPGTDSLPELVDQQREALTLRPDLRFALLNADRARADQALAHAQRWEDWTVSFGFEQGRQVIDGGAPQRASRTVGVTLSIPLPFVNGNQGRSAEAAAAGNQAYARIDALRLDILNEVAGVHAEAARLQHVIEEYQRNMLPLSERNVHLAQQGYDQGLVSIVEVVQAQRQQGELNSAYLSTLDQYLQALSKLHAATGSYLRNIEQSGE